LIELLQDQSSLLRERIALRERIRTLSAESRLSAWIMGLMPFIVSALMYLISPKTMSLLWTTPAGLNLLQAGFLMQLLGVFWIWRLVRIDV
jgi:tight adherence protein B